ncbi:hypothetical protein MPTK1_3g05020 [Marchantia polymorpha subsp. ruderalis]|uniref:Uncharacterized protein n=2 Tax=Marchantia polymorpha TaxID=3197 RepID=A0AAF6AXJ7_MARPO|nr:hypothetical protein MARPO_0022s0026 [Marchantia polymorpha]BBN04481.1 hypothetical protein Mp_3g05020 [Marchantia polymorpha subsp. ruderalis]|eukprot:PTQ43919.1 hypothetical protein MARPO_0022s0026 [Marchantia polymorpha]
MKAMSSKDVPDFHPTPPEARSWEDCEAFGSCQVDRTGRGQPAWWSRVECCGCSKEKLFRKIPSTVKLQNGPFSDSRIRMHSGKCSSTRRGTNEHGKHLIIHLTHRHSALAIYILRRSTFPAPRWI